MPAKAPIYLKPSNNKKGKKCRLRDLLSPDMISPPLGDFRHTIHIGKGGQRDAFGDMSFLQGNYELLPGKGDANHQYGIQSEFLRANSTGDAFAETPSPVLKNAISLPTIGGCQALTLPLIPSSMFPMPLEPLEDIINQVAPTKADSNEEVEILQMDALLRSIDVFNSKPEPPSPGIPTKPDVLLDLLESRRKSTKAVANANKINKSETRFDKPASFYISSNSSSSTFNANGSLNSNTSSDSFDSLSGKGDFQDKISNGSHSGNGNGYGSFDNELSTAFEQEKYKGEWVDRDSGVEEGRICDFELEFSKEKSTSEESLSQVAGSFLSLELDLGPSILDDVLNIMDKPAVKSRP